MSVSNIITELKPVENGQNKNGNEIVDYMKSENLTN